VHLQEKKKIWLGTMVMWEPGPWDTHMSLNDKRSTSPKADRYFEIVCQKQGNASTLEKANRTNPTLESEQVG
jgi:hypothetical protein